VPLTVTLRGDHELVASVPGEPDYLLNPKRGTKFQLAEYAGITIEFKRTDVGKVTEAVLDQMGTVIILKKK
jgi:hypothetical protein